jgi:hypothetical protein
VQLIRGVFHLDISIFWFRVSVSSSVFPGVFIGEDVEGVGDKFSGDTVMVHTQALLESFFEHFCEIFLFQ